MSSQAVDNKGIFKTALGLVGLSQYAAVGINLIEGAPRAWNWIKSFRESSATSDKPANQAPANDQEITLRPEQLEAWREHIKELNVQIQQMRSERERTVAQNGCLKVSLVALLSANALAITMLFWRSYASLEA